MQQQQVRISQLPTKPQRSANLSQYATPIQLVSNHFKMSFHSQQKIINVYNFQIFPDIARDARRLKEIIFQSASPKIKEAGLTQFQIKGQNLWSNITIKEPIVITTYVHEHDSEYTIKIEFSRQFCFDDILDDDKKNTNPIVQSINIIIKQSLKKIGLIEIGRNSKFYDPASIDKNKIPDQALKVWRGFKTALHIFNGIPYCLIDFSSRILRDETALEFIQSINGTQNDIARQIIGLSVIATYGNYRIYKIDDIDFSIDPTHKFTLQDGTQLSYIDYYQTRYKLTIKRIKQPLLIYRDKKNPEKITHLIPEFMKMTGMKDSQRSDFKLMKAVSQYTKLDPDQRNQQITMLQKQLKKQLINHEIEISSDQRLQGYQLIPPQIILGNNKKLQNDVGFFIIKDSVLNPIHLKDWFMIYYARSQRDHDDADFFVKQLITSAAKIGIKVEDPYYIPMNNTHIQAWINELDMEMKKGGKPQLILSFIPDRERDRLYTPLKDFCLSNIGVSHQNVLHKFIRSKNTQSLAAKLIQQINVKLGYPVWNVTKPVNISQRVMLIGIDIYHKIITGNRSCYGFVASLDSNFSTYYSRVLTMKKGQEMAHNISSMVQLAIEKYFEFNKKQFLPDTIVVYRDGVGEAQVKALMEIEISQIKNGFTKISEQYNPQFAFIIINKKINHRFFALKQQQQQQYQNINKDQVDNLVNPPSGTIIGDQVVSKQFDFFLCAQYVTQGTCTPTHYIVLENSTNWKEEQFWMLTYYQCFNYMNWSGSVRVPGVVQYAHKLSYLVGETFQKNINSNLDTLLLLNIEFLQFYYQYIKNVVYSSS